jgi:hypothetical protein
VGGSSADQVLRGAANELSPPQVGQIGVQIPPKKFKQRGQRIRVAAAGREGDEQRIHANTRGVSLPIGAGAEISGPPPLAARLDEDTTTAGRRKGRTPGSRWTRGAPRARPYRCSCTLLVQF